MRRIPLGTLLLAALFLGVALLFAGLGLGRALRPDEPVLAYEVKDLIATLQAAVTSPFRESDASRHGRGPGYAPPILWGVGALLVAAIALGLRARQQRSRINRS